MWILLVGSYFSGDFVRLLFNGKEEKKMRKPENMTVFSPDKWAEDRRGELIFL